MKTEHIVIDYSLVFRAAFHCGTGLRGGLIHRLAARDADDYLYIPGSTLKGALRERCAQLAQVWDLEIVAPHYDLWREANPNRDIVTQTFGSRFYPGQLAFDDALMVKEDRDLFESPSRDNEVRQEMRSKFRAWQTEKRTQVSLSRLTGTASSGMLYTSEYGICDLRFAGRITGMLGGVPLLSSEPGTFSLLLLVSGLLSLERVGGNKSTGAGACLCEITHMTIDQQTWAKEVLLANLPDWELYELAFEEATL